MIASKPTNFVQQVDFSGIRSRNPLFYAVRRLFTRKTQNAQKASSCPSFSLGDTNYRPGIGRANRGKIRANTGRGKEPVFLLLE